MTDQKAKEFIEKTFGKVTTATSIDDVKSIIDTCTNQKNRMSEAMYPELKFGITAEEINQLIASGVIDQEHNFSSEMRATLTDPLTKLLYATAWKNGDLLKIKHIIRGVLACDDASSDQENAIVFHHFGKHLAKKQGQPIIDQHVIRAFGVFSAENEHEVQEMRQLSTVGKKHNPLISAYKEWLVSDSLSNELKLHTDYSYHIDKLLFALGKTVKYPKKKEPAQSI